LLLFNIIWKQNKQRLNKMNDTNATNHVKIAIAIDGTGYGSNELHNDIFFDMMKHATEHGWNAYHYSGPGGNTPDSAAPNHINHLIAGSGNTGPENLIARALRNIGHSIDKQATNNDGSLDLTLHLFGHSRGSIIANALMNTLIQQISDQSPAVTLEAFTKQYTQLESEYTKTHDIRVFYQLKFPNDLKNNLHFTSFLQDPVQGALDIIGPDGPHYDCRISKKMPDPQYCQTSYRLIQLDDQRAPAKGWRKWFQTFPPVDKEVLEYSSKTPLAWILDPGVHAHAVQNDNFQMNDAYLGAGKAIMRNLVQMQLDSQPLDSSTQVDLLKRYETIMKHWKQSDNKHPRQCVIDLPYYQKFGFWDDVHRSLIKQHYPDFYDYYFQGNKDADKIKVFEQLKTLEATYPQTFKKLSESMQSPLYNVQSLDGFSAGKLPGTPVPLPCTDHFEIFTTNTDLGDYSIEESGFSMLLSHLAMLKQEEDPRINPEQITTLRQALFAYETNQTSYKNLLEAAIKKAKLNDTPLAKELTDVLTDQEIPGKQASIRTRKLLDSTVGWFIYSFITRPVCAVIRTTRRFFFTHRLFNDRSYSEIAAAAGTATAGIAVAVGTAAATATTAGTAGAAAEAAAAGTAVEVGVAAAATAGVAEVAGVGAIAAGAGAIAAAATATAVVAATKKVTKAVKSSRPDGLTTQAPKKINNSPSSRRYTSTKAK
jgi:hypothetical protein